MHVSEAPPTRRSASAAFIAALPLPRSRSPAAVARRPRVHRSTPTARTHPPSPESKPSASPRVSRRTLLSAAALTALAAALPCAFATPASSAAATANKSAYDLSPSKDGEPYALSVYRGKTTLFVNVASYCALTPQYEGLVALHDAYSARGFDIVASPCNQFGRQEPGDDASICEFVRSRFGANFLLLDKLIVNDGVPGAPVAPLYRFLRDDSPERAGERVAWNFEKFLVGPDGHVLRRYKPGILPEDIEKDVKFALSNPGKPLPAKKKPYLGVE